jgi:tRNA/tmRNA/rRNA uracil-C5-methylase (TrmA/RlmC/RlmD family)
LKKIRVKRCLSEISSDHLFGDIIPTAVELGFRNRAKFKIIGDPQRFEVRGTDPLSGEVSALEAARVLPEWGRKLVADTIGLISLNLSDHWIDGFEVQLAHGKKHAHLTLSVKRSECVSYSKLADLLLNKISGLKGVAVPSQKSDFGESYLHHDILGKTFVSHYTAFFQPNLQLTPRLLEDVQENYPKKHTGRIVDFYCGVGLFSLFLAKNDTEIMGADNNKRAIESARRNAESMKIIHASFVCSSIDTYASRIRLFPDDFVLIDPPRSGCSHTFIETITGHGPRYVCSISCCLKTHIRDLKHWLRRGYSIQSFSAFDMFPFTEFLETVAFLTKRP